MKDKSTPWVWLLVAMVVLSACVPKNTPTANIPPGPTQPQPARTPAPTSTAVELTQPGPLTGLEPGWWKDAIFYEIFVRSFKDSDGDGIGDFNGITASLDYLNDGDPATSNDLGVTALWLMPIMPSPSYHGYDITDYYTVNAQYGSKEDFLRLVEEAHKRGIRVIIDLVMNHTSREHPWFLASDSGDPLYRNWYIWQEKDPKYLGPWSEQVWYPGKQGFYYAVFWSGMPDLNLENPDVTGEMYKVVQYWLEEMHVDGFRLDAVRYYVENGRVQADTKTTHQWLQHFFQFYKSLDPGIFTVGEAWTDTAGVVSYTGDQMDMAFEFDLAGAFVRSANGPIASSATTQLNVVLKTYPKGDYGVFLTNHDQDRVMSVLAGDVQKAKLAAVMLLTAPGVPFIYYGEEIGMTGVKPDEDIRRPMQWTDQMPGAGFTTGQPWRAPAINDAVTNVAAQEDDPDSLLNLYRQLTHLRNAHTALSTGDTLVIDAGTARLYAILRYDANAAYLILINTHPTALSPERYRLNLANGPFQGSVQVRTVYGLSGAAAPQINSNGGFQDYHPFSEIPPHSATILELKP